MPAPVSGSIRSAVYTWLTEQSTVTDLVGADVFPLKAPQGTPRPWIVYRRADGEQEYQLAGSADTAHARFEFTLAADTYATADAIATALAQALDTINRTSVAGLTLFNATIPPDGEEDDFAEPIDAGDTGLYLIRMQADFFFTGSNANP